MRTLLRRFWKYCSDSAVMSTGTHRVLNVSFNEQSCNLNCRVCGFSTDKVRTMYAEPSAMDRATFETLLSHLPSHRNFWFDISAIAETLQFRDLAEFIALLKTRKPNVKTIISTSGTLLTERSAEALVSSGLDFVQFSLYAPDAEGYRFITQTPFPFAKTLEKLDLLLEKRGTRAQPIIHVFIYDMQDFRVRAKPFPEQYESRVDAVYFRPLYDTAGVVEHRLGDAVPRGPRRYPCPTLWYSGAVRSTGEYLRCYPMHWLDRTHTVGNVREDNLQGYWNKLDDVRQLHLQGRWDEVPGCKDCDVWSQAPSFFSRRADGTFFIPRHRVALSMVINGVKRYLKRQRHFVSH